MEEGKVPEIRYARSGNVHTAFQTWGDAASGSAGIEERIDDIRAVMDELELERAFVGGISEGGPMAMLFAATYPERVAGLILSGTAARFSAAPDNPGGIPREQLAALGDRLAADWGTPACPFTRIEMPSPAADEGFLAWMRRYERSCASPGAVRGLLRFVADVDVRAALETITVPTLVVHRAGDQ